MTWSARMILHEDEMCSRQIWRDHLHVSKCSSRSFLSGGADPSSHSARRPRCGRLSAVPPIRRVRQVLLWRGGRSACALIGRGSGSRLRPWGRLQPICGRVAKVRLFQRPSVPHPDLQHSSFRRNRTSFIHCFQRFYCGSLCFYPTECLRFLQSGPSNADTIGIIVCSPTKCFRPSSSVTRTNLISVLSTRGSRLRCGRSPSATKLFT